MVRAIARREQAETSRTDDSLIRRRIRCRGVVQGVGFRPAVYRVASSLGLVGGVRNDADGATIEVEGEPARVLDFIESFPSRLPPLAQLGSVDVEELPTQGDKEFSVEHSRLAVRRRALIPFDAVLCDDCRGEMDAPAGRRHRYPFTTCTNCGPRFSLVRTLPYDRERTSMAIFPLCEECEGEYTQPSDRRFHAEPICCPNCGPRLWLLSNGGERLAEDQDSLTQVRDVLARGCIVAVKGLGGFQLACRADDLSAIARLRAAKQRPSKPFAMMVRNLDFANQLVWLRPEDESLLRSSRGPILLAPRRDFCELPEALAPGVGDLGVMLPTTPLHVELFRGADYGALVMTSGNASDEPIARTNEEAQARLSGIATHFLLHDREVVRRIDDSVVRTAARGFTLIRRSRGFAPEPIALPCGSPEPVLALGGHLQVTGCLAVGEEAFASQHVGDLDTEPARRFLEEVCGGLEDFLEVEAKCLAVDLHPDYPSRWLGERLAEQRAGRVIEIPHHLAHAASVLGEHAALPCGDARAVAIVLDGTGWGMDKTAWGCEWLVLGGDLHWQRLACGTPLALVGGERAVREPWRVVAAALVHEEQWELLQTLGSGGLFAKVPFEQVGQLASTSSWPLASGAGRIFEAAGALFGLGISNRWEGECAAAFESLAASAQGEVQSFEEVQIADGATQLPTAGLLVAAAKRLSRGEDAARCALGFHLSFCRLAAELSARVIPGEVRTLALGGGCLVNRILREQLQVAHEAKGFRVLTAEKLPPGDGGLAYGQVVLAAASLARGMDLHFEGGSNVSRDSNEVN